MNESIDQIILRYLENRATLSEKEILLSWLQESEEHVHFFKQWALSWEKTTMAFSEREEMDRQMREIFLTIRSRNKISRRVCIASIAAAILCFLVIKIFVTQGVSDDVIISAGSEKKEVILPDKSVVWLNKGSRLKYPQQFSKERDVYLEGEGYFDVQKDTKHIFRVITEHFTVKVLGTQFVVTDKKNIPFGEVILEEGRISLSAKDFPGDYLLKPNQMLRYDKKEKSVDIESVSAANYSKWKNNQLVFTNTLLRDVFVQLARWYDISVICASTTLEEIPVSLTVDKESKEEIFSLLALIAHFNYQIDGDVITVR